MRARKRLVKIRRGKGSEIEWTPSDWAGVIILTVALIVGILLLAEKIYEAMVAAFFGGGFGLSELLRHFEREIQLKHRPREKPRGREGGRFS